ncbi:MAG: hypothetical protein ABGX16_03905 [Pirellulales bacterium]
MYQSGHPAAPYQLLPAGLPAVPSSAEFHDRIAATGAAMGQAGVVAVYCVHGTFAGNDALGLMTELARVVPSLSKTLSQFGKQTVDWVAGEMGNFTPAYVAAMESGLSAGAGRSIPVIRFNWSSQNNHIGRADGAVRLLKELACLAKSLTDSDRPEPQGPAATALASMPLATTAPAAQSPPRIVLWGHSHAGNLFALLTNLLAANSTARKQFYRAARCFYRQNWSGRIDMPAWLHGQQMLREMQKIGVRRDLPEVQAKLQQAASALKRVALDVVTFGTPIRYGWSAAGHANLLHFVNHRPLPNRDEFLAPYPLDPLRVLTAADGDTVQQIGIAGSNLYPNLLAWRTVLSDWRLGKLLEKNLPRERLLQRVSRGMRVPDTGTTLLVDYPDHESAVRQRLLGHAVYTRLRWLPFHLEQLVKHCYRTEP